MALESLFSLLDDLALVLDDCWVMTQKSASKTAGVLGDDLALNAEQVVGLRPERELPVIWAVAKGSALNKVLLIPAALALKLLAPWAIAPLLVAGGVFLCFEGVEKVEHKWSGPVPDTQAHLSENSPVDLVQLEAHKIRSAIRTDFILSAEILAITLGVVADQTWLKILLVLLAISVLMTLGVYGTVAGIVKIDDLGLRWISSPSPWKVRLGSLLLRLAPRLLAGLSLVGTAAVFSVGGGLVSHAIPPLHHHLESLPGWASLLAEALVGVLAGLAAVGLFKLWKKFR